MKQKYTYLGAGRVKSHHKREDDHLDRHHDQMLTEGYSPSDLYHAAVSVT
jgi:hypothetical protein